MDSCIRLTREILQSDADPLFKKPRLTDTLLQRPPFRFIHDIISSVQRKTGFAQGLFSHAESNPKTLNREGKIAYLQKIIDYLDVEVDPAKVVAGLDPERTNALLQALGTAARKQQSSQHSQGYSPANAPEKSPPPEVDAVLSKRDGEERPASTVISDVRESDGVSNAEEAVDVPHAFGEVASSHSLEADEFRPKSSYVLRLEREETFARKAPSILSRPPSRRHPSERPIEALDTTTNVPDSLFSALEPWDTDGQKTVETHRSTTGVRPSSGRRLSENSNTSKDTTERPAKKPTVDVLCLEEDNPQTNDACLLRDSPRPAGGGRRDGTMSKTPTTKAEHDLISEPPASLYVSRPQTARKPPPSPLTSRRPISSRGRLLTSRSSKQQSSESNSEAEAISMGKPSMSPYEGALVRDLKGDDATCEEQQDDTLASVKLQSVGEIVERLLGPLDGLRRCLEHLSCVSEAAEKERHHWKCEIQISREKLNEQISNSVPTDDLAETIQQTQFRIRTLKTSNNSRDKAIERMIRTLSERTRTSE